MDDKIFIREQQQSNGNRTQIIVIALAAIFILVGLVGIIAIVTNGNSRSNTNTTATTPDSSPDNTPEETPPAEEPAPEPTPTQDPEPTPTPVTPPGAEPVYTAPTDATKIHLYYPKSPETDTNPAQLVAAARTKPESNVTNYAISEVMSGPNAEERAAGYKRTWSFTGTSTCSNKTYKYSISGSLLRIDLCKEYSGSAPEQLIDALKVSLSQVSSVRRVAIITPGGACLGKAAGDMSCLN